jgi:hypothetical protein
MRKRGHQPHVPRPVVRQPLGSCCVPRSILRRAQEGRCAWAWHPTWRLGSESRISAERDLRTWPLPNTAARASRPNTYTPYRSQLPDRVQRGGRKDWRPSPPSRLAIHGVRGPDVPRIQRPLRGDERGGPARRIALRSPSRPSYVRPRDLIYLLDFFNPILDAFFLTASVGRPSEAATSAVGRSGNSRLSCFTSSLVHEPFVPILAIS